MSFTSAVHFKLSIPFIGFITYLVSHADESLPVYELTPVTVTAPRFITVDTEVAARVRLIDQQTINESGALNLIDLLRNQANLHFRSTSGNTVQSEVSLGGFGEGSGQRVLVLLDGHRLNTADLGQINWLSIPLSQIESIEVIQGGQSALYGNSAVGGVIKITTLKPSDELEGQAQISGGSFDSFNARASMSGREGSLGFSVHTEHDQTQGYRQNSHYDATGAGLKLDWTQGDWLTAHGSVSGVSSEYGLPASLTLAAIDTDRKQSTSPDDTGEDDSIFVRGGFGVCLGDYLSLGLDGGFTTKEIYSDFISFGSTLEQEYEIISISPSLTYQSGPMTAVVGIDYYDDAVDGLSSGFGTTPYEFSRETLAGFGSAKWELNQDWILSGTFRAEAATTYGVTQGVQSEDIDDNQYAWSLGLIRFFEGGNRIYGSVRRFYRYPATDEIITVFFTPVPVINFDLKPEWGHELEFGGDWAFGNLTLGGRVFHQWMRDEVFLDYVTFASFNLDRTRRIGMDINARFDLTRRLHFLADYTWIDAEIDSGINKGRNVPLVPEHKLRLAANYNPSDPIHLGIGATFTDEVFIGGDYSNMTETIPSYVLFDLSVRYRYSESLEIFAVVDNLFDKEYLSSGFSGFFNDGYYPGTGRSARIGASLSF